MGVFLYHFRLNRQCRLGEMLLWPNRIFSACLTRTLESTTALSVKSRSVEDRVFENIISITPARSAIGVKFVTEVLPKRGITTGTWLYTRA